MDIRFRCSHKVRQSSWWQSYLCSWMIEKTSQTNNIILLLLWLTASVAVKVNRLKRLKSSKVKVGVENSRDSVNGGQDVFKTSPVEDSQRQFHLSVVNSSVTEEKTDSTSTSSFYKSNYTYSDNENLKMPVYNSNLETSGKRSLVNGELPCVHVVSTESSANKTNRSSVPGMVEQSATNYRISTTSEDSQQTSNHQLVETEDAREACVSSVKQLTSLS